MAEIDENSGPTATDAARAARARRANRQARVGILANPNRAPLPPPHRPPLMGRWPPLRSSRRPPARGAAADDPGGLAAGAPAAGPADAPALVVDKAGSILQIDIARLDAMAEALIPRSGPVRAPFAGHILGPAAAPRPPGATGETDGAYCPAHPMGSGRPDPGSEATGAIPSGTDRPGAGPPGAAGAVAGTHAAVPGDPALRLAAALRAAEQPTPRTEPKAGPIEPGTVPAGWRSRLARWLRRET